MLMKIISLVLIAGQLAWAGVAFSGTTQDPTPEVKFFRRSIALAGKDLSGEELKAKLTDVYARYLSTAEPEGQMERVEQALADLYGPEEAHDLALAASRAAARIGAGASASSEMTALASKYPRGAQFSSCQLAITIGVAGATTAIIGGSLWALGNAANNKDANGNFLHYPDVHQEHVGELIAGLGILGIIDAIVIGVYSHDC